MDSDEVKGTMRLNSGHNTGSEVMETTVMRKHRDIINFQLAWRQKGVAINTIS